MEDVRKPTYDELLAENAQLKIKAAKVDELEQEVIALKAQVDKLTKMLFGKKSEKSKKDKEKKTAPPSNEPKQRRNNNGGGGRKPFPPGIPRRDVHVSLPPDECCCANCGKEFEPMGVEITEVLNVIPMICEVIRFIRQRMKAVCSCAGNKIIIAEMPIRNIDKGSVTTEFIAAVLVNKYCDHLPIHRQVGRLLKNATVEIAESSVCRWRDQVADQLEDLVDLMKSEIKQSYCINTDASPAPVRFPDEKNHMATGNMYVYIGGEDHPYNIFDVQPNQTAAPIYEFLVGYFGVIQCDAHGNYNALFIPKNSESPEPVPQESGCHAHCRRYFVDAEKTEPEWVKRFLDIYKKLYKIESEVRETTAEEKYRRRQRDSVPILDALFDLCRECRNDPLVLPKSPLGQAVTYALNNETALRRYCTDGRLNIDNNISERTLREFVVGRKNWLFFGSPESAKKSAIVMSVLSSARRHGLNEWEYLVDVLYRLSDWNPRTDSLENLLPDRWVKSTAPPTEAAALVAAR
jgi:transposase